MRTRQYQELRKNMAIYEALFPDMLPCNVVIRNYEVVDLIPKWNMINSYIRDH